MSYALTFLIVFSLRMLLVLFMEIDRISINGMVFKRDFRYHATNIANMAAIFFLAFACMIVSVNQEKSYALMERENIALKETACQCCAERR